MITKFRVWNIPLGQYINKDYSKKYFINFDGVLCSFNDFGLVIPLDMKNYIIEQYIGHPDKNDVEVYKGDVVKSYDNLNREEMNLCVVDFNCGSFMLREMDLDFISHYRLMDYEIEVIGNIHDGVK